MKSVQQLNEEILNKLKNGPLVLFLGQNYLEIGCQENLFLKEVYKKFGANRTDLDVSFSGLLKLGLNSSSEEATSWMDNLSRYINPSAAIQKMAEMPWSAVYTSAIDPVINHVFENDWRKVQIVFDDRFRINDPRNKTNLHITKIFGCLSRTLPEQKAPLSIPEKSKRQFIANNLLQRIPETVSAKGLLVIEGFSLQDWLNFEQSLYPVIAQLGKAQTIFCSVTDELKNNESFVDLVESKKVISVDENFAELITALEFEDKYSITTPEYEDRYAKYLTIEGRKLKIPKELFHKISRSAIVIDDHLFDYELIEDEDEKYILFKDFLASNNINNIWKGYPNGFAFKRDYYETLKLTVANKLKFNNIKSQPVILYGQSGGGKTIALGNLAYDLKKELQFPIIYIERKFQKIDEQQVDEFCRWAEEQGARGTVIIWDGMIEPDVYYNLLEKLNARGRNIVVIGSAYDTKRINSNYINSTAELGEDEKRRFGKFISAIDPILSNIIPYNDRNILSMFYRYLPVSRYNIQQGLRSEFEHFRNLIKDYTSNQNSQNSKPAMFELMRQAGLIASDSYDDEINFDQEEEVDGEKITLADKLIYSIMVPGQFGVDVPFEVLVRDLGYSMVSSTPFRLLSIINFVIWKEDSIGNISVGPRTPIEARIIAGYLGNKRAQISYIKSLLGSISCDDFLANGSSYESNREIQFAVDLLYAISPNGPIGPNSPYSDFTYELAEVLRDLREGNYAYHPRLILKEASFLREIVKNNWKKGNETNQDLLERAQTIVETALDDLEAYQDMFITNFLRVELASIMGSQMHQSINEKDKARAKECYDAVKVISSPSFASHPDNYGAFDVLAWTTTNLIKSRLLNDEELLNAEASLLNLIELSESEGVSPQHMDEFNGRKLTFFDLMGRDKLSDEIFTKMANEGSTTGYYIRANSYLIENKDSEISHEERLLKYTNAYYYLEGYYAKIVNDGKCLFLLFRCWWMIQTKSYLLSDEKKTVPLSMDEWEYCLTICNRILSCEGYEDVVVILFIKGLAEFHLGLMPDMSLTFKHLDPLTDFSSYGSRRIIKSYIASTEDGSPKTFSGEVFYNVDVNRHNKFGEIYINELKIKVPFSLYEFQQTSFQKGQTLRNFQIGFNFRGPIAVYNKFI